jgi:hypothetical protein
MRILFSLIALLLVVGLIAFWSVENTKKAFAPIDSVEVQSNAVVEPGGTPLAPIDAAKNAKNLIESRTAEQLSE